MGIRGLKKTIDRWRRRVGGGVCAGPLVVSVIVLVSVWTQFGPTKAFADTGYLDVSGGNEYETSVRVSKLGFGPGVEGLVVANGDDPQIAAASAVLARAYGGPLLLTPANTLVPGIVDEVWRLGPGWVFVVGTGPEVVSGIARAFPEAAASGRVVLLCGNDGPSTALLVARQVAEKSQSSDGVVLISADHPPMTEGVLVAASTLAAAKTWPILVVPSAGVLPEGTQEVLSDLSPSLIVKVETSVDVPTDAVVVGLTGNDQYDLGVKIAEYATTVGLSYQHIALVRGDESGSDHGLALGAYLAQTQGVALVSGGEDVSPEGVGLLIKLAGSVQEVDTCGLSEQGIQQARLLLDAYGLPAGFGETVLKLNAEGPEVVWLEQRLTDLSYRPGPIDGVFDKRTRMAVIAFQKWEGLTRDGVVGEQVWWGLLRAVRPAPQYAQEGAENAPDGKWIEVNKTKQVLLYCDGGVVERTLAVSTGNPSVGVTTPSGIYFVRRENTRERLRYKPLYLSSRTLLAIHGYPSVPTYPASHGCIRMTWADMDEFHELAPLGTPVLVYD